jgi:hypothetical protein
VPGPLALFRKRPLIDALSGGDTTMMMFMGGPIPVPHTVAGSGDGLVAVVAILLFAIAVTVALVYANRPVKIRPAVKATPVEIRPAVKATPVDSNRKAA